MSTDTTRKNSIASAGPDFEHLLAQEVVIEATQSEARTGAQVIAPEHSPRAPLSSVGAAAHVPRAGLIVAIAAGADLQREVEQFLYLQAELLDAKQWQAWMDLFDASGV